MGKQKKVVKRSSLTNYRTPRAWLLGRGDTTVLKCIRNQSIMILMSSLYRSLSISIYGCACTQSESIKHAYKVTHIYIYCTCITKTSTPPKKCTRKRCLRADNNLCLCFPPIQQCNNSQGCNALSR